MTARYLRRRTRRDAKFDRTRIDLSAPQEVRYWCHALGVDEALLREIVALHGSSVDTVRAAIDSWKRTAKPARPGPARPRNR